jgi:hypothetical protein
MPKTTKQVFLFQAPSDKQFKIGDEVEWSSQAQGSWTSKRGKVVEVVGAGRFPHKTKSESPRREQSYVVDVEILLKRGGVKVVTYWPRTDALKLASKAPARRRSKRAGMGPAATT